MCCTKFKIVSVKLLHRGVGFKFGPYSPSEGISEALLGVFYKLKLGGGINHSKG